MAEQNVSEALIEPSPVSLDFDSIDTDESSESESWEIHQILSFESPPKKLKKQDFNLCLICNARKSSKLNRWTQQSWNTFCSAAQRIQDETFVRLENFISNREQLPSNITQLWKHADCYSKYKNPKNVEQKERMRLNTTAANLRSPSFIPHLTAQQSGTITTRSKVSETFIETSCLICMKERRWLKRQKKHEYPMKITLTSAGDAIIQSALERNDERILREIGQVSDGGDMIAKEIMVHNSCRAVFTSKQNLKYAQFEKQDKRESVYEDAFKKVASEVEQRVIRHQEVVKMTDLVHKFNDVLASINYPSSYQSSKLKSRLLGRFGTQIAFWHPKSRNESGMVYSNEMPKNKLLKAALQAQKDKCEESDEEDMGLHNLFNDTDEVQDRPDELRYAFTTSLQIHNDIQLVQQLPWPPRPEDMTEENIDLPNSLYNTLAWIIGGDPYDRSQQQDTVNQDKGTFSAPAVTRFQTPTSSGHFDGQLYWREKRVQVHHELHRKILSIGQDIVHAGTNSRILTVKHVLLAKAVQQKTGSLSVVTLLNQNQHCINKTLLQEMDTANAEYILSQNDLGYHMPQGMIPNVLPVFGWDNNDFRNRGHFSGSAQVHDTTGYMAQPRTNLPKNTKQTKAMQALNHPKSRRRSVKAAEEELLTCIISKKTEPRRYQDASSQLSELNPSVSHKAKATDLVWKLARMNSTLDDNVKPEDQKIQGWKGFNRMMESTSSQEVMPHNIAYCQTIHKAPDNDVIYTFLCRSVEMTDNVMDTEHGRGSCSVQVAVDMGIWMKAIQVILSKRETDERMKRIVLHQGPFHTAMRFLGCPGYLFGSAGLRDIFIEAGIVAEGSIDKVLKGEHWERGFYAHSLAAEAFHRLRFIEFVKQLEGNQCLETIKKDIDRLRHDTTSVTLQNLIKSQSFAMILSLYDEFIRSLGPNGKFWSIYIDMIDILLRHVRATRTGDWLLHLQTEIEMLPWFFACGKNLYARYKPLYILMMLDLGNTHKDAEEQLINGNLFTIQKSNNVFSRIPTDQETEMGVNRDSKSPGGIADISMNHSATLKWEVLSTQRAEFVRRLSVLTGDTKERIHEADDAGKARIKRDEESVQQIMETVIKWSNPFSDNGPLCHISSGRQASEEVANDMLNSHEKGKANLVQFVKQRLETLYRTDKESDDWDESRQNTEPVVGSSSDNTPPSFYNKWPKLTLRNFASMAKLKKCTIKGQTFTMRYTRDLFHKMVVVASHRGLNINEVLQFPLGPLPYSLATEAGGLVKTVKSSLMHELEKIIESEEVPLETTHQVVILDAMAIIQTIRLASNATFKDLAETVLNIIMSHISKSTCNTAVHWVCDTYPSISIKNAERETRMKSAEGSFATTITSANQRVDKQFKKALRDGNFKESLAQFLIEEWSEHKYARIIKNHTIYATSGSRCNKFHVEQDMMVCTEVPELMYRMEEADQRLILHAHFASHQVPQPDVVTIRSPDTDVMVLASAACGLGWITSKCLFLTGTGSKKRFISLSSIGAKLGQATCDGLIGAHPFTGCDSTAAFKGRGKASVVWLLKNNATFCSAMSLLGRSIPPSDEVFTACEKATCLLYAYNARSKKLQSPSSYSVNELRAIMFVSGTSDPAKLPPCSSALRKKVLRANYQAYLNRHCIVQEQEFPSPNGQGWIVTGPDEIQVDWMDIQPAPSVVLSLACCGCKTDCKSNQCRCKKNGLKCTGICTCSKDCQNMPLNVDFVDYSTADSDLDVIEPMESDSDIDDME